MPVGTIDISFNVGAIAASGTVLRTGDGTVGLKPALPAGSAGTLSTRTDDDTGVATLGAGHGITITDFVDVYWSGGLRYGMDVTAVDGNDVSVNVGAGDNLPAQDTVLVVTKRVLIDTDWDGDNVQMIAALTDQRSHIEFITEGDVSILAVELPASEAWFWAADQGIANPLTGTPVGKISASCGSATAATTLKLGLVQDTTP